MKRTHPITVPAHVRAVDLGPATVIVNYRNGRTESLIGPAARWWQQATASSYADVPGVLDELAEQTLRGQLIGAGLIEPTATDRPQGFATPQGPPWVPSWGTQEMAAGRVEPVPVPLGAAVRAGLALAVVLGVLAAGRERTRMARLVRLLTAASAGAGEPAPAERIRQAVHAVRRAGLVIPGRVACLEESAAVVLMLAASRYRVTWCHGAAADPVRIHAWVEDDQGQPVAEPPSTAARFAVLRTVPDQQGDNQR